MAYASAGQTLIVIAGCGWAQHEGGSTEEIHPGDVVWFAPNEKHWHGATSTTAMTHIAIQEKKDGKVVDWMEQRLSVGGGLRCTVTSTRYELKGCGLEFTVTPVYPAKRSSVHAGSHGEN